MMNLRNRILFGLIFGPLLAVVIAKVIVSLSGSMPFASLWFIPAFALVIAVVIKAVVIRAVAGLSTFKAYLLSLVLCVTTLWCSVLCIVLTGYIYSYVMLVVIPSLIIILGVAYRIKAGPNPLGGLYIATAAVISIAVELALFSVFSSLIHPPAFMLWLESIIFFTPLFLLAPLLEVWPASLFLTKTKVVKTVVLSSLAILFFIVNAAFTVSIFYSWLMMP